MKKFALMMFAAATIAVVSCGPSAEESAKIEAAAKAEVDSIMNAAAASMATDAAATAVDSAAVATEAAPATEVK